MPVVYKTLFEVKLTHEFYLTRTNGETIFSFAPQDARLAFLQDHFNADKQSINEALEFKFPENLDPEYSGYHLKLLSTYSGFQVVIRVDQQKLADGSLVYKAFAALPDNLVINVLFSKKGTAIDTFTNTRIAAALPAIYFFSNDKVLSERSFPYLTNAISTQRFGYTYEQGELASFGTADIRSYYQNSLGDQWDSFSGDGFVNENDRLLLPLKFYYSFPEEFNVTDASFALKNMAGDTIKSIVVTGSNIIHKTLLDFSALKDQLTITTTATIADFIYSLEVTANGGYNNTHNILFQDDFYDKEVWGMAGISIKTSNTDFDLFSNDGYLVKRRDAAGVWTEAPIFEIPVKSRFVYWRYINNQGNKIQSVVADLNGYLNLEDGMLLSKKPRSVSQSFVLLQKEGSTAMRYVPNPIDYNVKRDTKQRLCFDIMVPQSDHFPTI